MPVIFASNLKRVAELLLIGVTVTCALDLLY